MLTTILQISAGLSSAASDSTNSPVNAGIQEVTETKMSLITMVMNGGYIMIPLGILLMVSIYVLIERMLVIGKASKVNSQFIPSLLQHLKEFRT